MRATEAEAIAAARHTHAAGRDAEALAAWRALADDPTRSPAARAAALHGEAVLVAEREPQRAAALLAEALVLAPDLPQAGEHLGALLAALGRHREAIACWRAALARAPGDAMLWCRLAALLRTAPASDGGEPAAAVAACRHARAAARPLPPGPEAAIQHETGLALLAAGRPGEAVAALLRARALAPGRPGVAGALGAALLARGDGPEAIAPLRAALAERPGDHASLTRLARALLAAGEGGAAIAALRRGLGQAPGEPSLLIALSAALLAEGRGAAALATLDPLLAPAPAARAALFAAGRALRTMDRPAEALERFAAAIATPAEPDAVEDAAIRHEAALARLALGDFAGGWPGWLSCRPGGSRLRLPRWEGGNPAGARIMLHGDGLSADTLMFLRYAPAVAGLGTRVWLRIPAELHSLVPPAPGLTLLAPDAPAPPCDLHCALADLPAVFGTTLATVPARVPYLAVPALASWRDAHPPGPARIALCSASPPAGSAASPERLPALLAALAAALPAARLYALGPPDARAVPGLGHSSALLDLRAETTDAVSLGAALAGMDLVLAPDGPALHLAGALARPCFALLGPGSDWRWLIGRCDSPWYPTMRLFRADATPEAIAAAARAELQPVVLASNFIRSDDPI